MKKHLLALLICSFTISGISYCMDDSEFISKIEISNIFQELKDDPEQAKIATEILRYRYLLLESVLAMSAESKIINSSFLASTDNFISQHNKLDNLDSKINPVLKSCLERFDEMLIKVKECSYQRLKPFINSYAIYNKFYNDLLKQQMKWLISVDSLYKKLIATRLATRQDTFYESLFILVKGLRKLNQFYVDDEEESLSIEQLQNDSNKNEWLELHDDSLAEIFSDLKQQLENYNYTIKETDKLVHNFIEPLLNKNKVDNQKQKFYFDILNIKNQLFIIKDKLVSVLAQEESIKSLSSVFNEIISFEHLNATTTARANITVFDTLLDIIKSEDRAIEEKNRIYPLLDILESQDKELITNAFYVFIKLSSEYHKLNLLYKELSEYIIELPISELNKKAASTLEQIKLFSQLAKLNNTSQNIEEYKKIYTQQLAEFKEKKDKVILYVHTNLLINYWSQLDIYLKQWNNIDESIKVKVLSLFDENECCKNIYNSTNSLLMQDQFKKSIDSNLSTLFIAPEYKLCYLAYIYNFLIGSDNINQELYINQSEIDQLKALALKFCQISDNKISKRKKKNRKKKKDKQATIVPKEPLLSSLSLTQPLKVNTQQDTPILKQDKAIINSNEKPRKNSRKNFTSMPWPDYMRFCEQHFGAFMSVISTISEDNNMAVLRNWRGYNSNEQMILVLYNIQAQPHDNNKYEVIIDSANLPKMADTLGKQWDKFHNFCPEVEQKYLSIFGQIINQDDNLSKQLNLRLKDFQYAIAIKAKINHDYYSFSINDNNSGINGYFVYIINSNTKKCTHRFFHKI